MSHALRRTSPKGQSFVGVCMKCGVEGLRLDQMHEEWPDVLNATQEEVLMMAIEPNKDPEL